MFLKNVLLLVVSVTLFFGALELILALAGVQPLLLTEDSLVGFAGNVPQFVETTRADGTAIIRTTLNKRITSNYQEFPMVPGMQGRTNEALDQCQAELELNPANQNAHYALAKL